MHREITDALKIIAQRLECEDINWVVIASSALALQGLDIDPVDIDIMTDERGLLIINRIFVDYAVSISETTPSAIFASTMSKFCINSCSIEVMSDFKIKSRPGNIWHDMDTSLKYRIILNLEDVKIPVLPLVQLIEMYTLMGRDKDMIKIQKIERHLYDANRI